MYRSWCGLWIALVVALQALIAVSAHAADFSHATWDGLLRKHVKSLRGGQATQVDYASLAAEHARFAEYLKATEVPELMKRLLPLIHHGVEVLFVDGGSTDGTAALAERAGFHMVHAEHGRTRQMNAGAAQANGDVLLFLHAGTRLPEGALQLVVLRREGSHCWDRFDVRISGRPAMLRVDCPSNRLLENGDLSTEMWLA